jgi:hypothetical protein
VYRRGTGSSIQGRTFRDNDWPAVLAVARENASAAGVAQRHKTIGGSVFDVDWGEGYDIVLLTNFLHHFDQDTCVDLLSRASGFVRGRSRTPRRVRS